MSATLDFDTRLIHAPFRMQPGLRRLRETETETQLTPLAAGSRLHAEKRAVLDAGASRFSLPGFDPGPALAAIADRAAADGVAMPAGPLELAFEEDFAVLDGTSGTLPWLCVCVPSHWAPEAKLGLDFAAVHSPVADNQLLLGASQHLVELATSGERWERHVWTLSPSPRHDQHPARHPRTPWPATGDAQSFAQACFFRAERQTFFPVGRGTRQAVFTIRVMVEPITTVIASPEDRGRLREALSSMSPDVLAYKGLAPARDPLLRWLSGSAG